VRVTAIVEDDGRISLPEAYRAVLGLKPGDEVVLVVNDTNGTIELIGTPDPVERAQAIVRRYISAERRLSEELIAERRDEARSG
jgi:AbrB family looped-hinge helix DNA binding protein